MTYEAKPTPLRELAPIAAVFVILMGVLWFGFDRYLSHRAHPNRHIGTASGAPTRIVLQPNRSGQYVVPGQINGSAVRFLVDTGADSVALSKDTARRLGLSPGQRITSSTAGGQTTAYLTRINRISVGRIGMRDISGVIVPAMKLGDDTVLLGRSFLKHVNFSQRAGKLVLEQPSAP